MKRLVTALAVALLVPVLAACGDDSPEAGDPPAIEVQDRGAEPRVRFAIDVEEGHSETTVMTLDQRIDAGQVVDVPPIELTLVNEVVRVDDEEVEVRTTYGAARVTEPDDPSAASIDEALDGVEGLASTTTFTRSGELLSSTLDVPDDLDPTIRQSVEQFGDQAAALTIAFPEEDLGVGATWSAESAIELNGIEIRQTTTYELTALDGDDYEIDVSVDQDYEPGTTDDVEVISGEGSTSGTLSGTIGTLVATEASSTGSNRVTLKASGQTQDVSTSIDLSVSTTVD